MSYVSSRLHVRNELVRRRSIYYYPFCSKSEANTKLLLDFNQKGDEPLVLCTSSARTPLDAVGFPLSFETSRSTFKTSRCNTCNIQIRLIKHLKHASETLTKTIENHCKHKQRLDKILATYV